MSPATSPPRSPAVSDPEARRHSWLPTRRSLRFRFVVALVALVGIVLTANGTLTLLTTRNALKEDIEREALAYAHLAAGPMAEAYRTYYHSGYGRFRVLATGVQSLNRNVVEVAIYDTDGRLLFESSEFRDDVFDPVARAGAVSDDPRIRAAVKSLEVASWRAARADGEEVFVVVAPDVEDWGRHQYSVAFTVSYASLREALLAASWKILALVLASVVLGVVMAVLLARQSLRPVEALTRAARALASGDLDERITLRTGDEFEVLAAAFDHMADRLAATIADLERTNRTLNQMNAELRDLDRVKSDLLANVSHELRTPITAIRGYAEALDDGLLGPIDESQRQALQSIGRNIDRLMIMIEQLLSYSRAERGLQDLELRSFDLDGLVTQVVEMIRTAHRTAARVVLEREGEIPHAFGDPTRIAQVVENLLSNAVKFTPPNGEVRVAVRLRTADRSVEVEVRDTGIGIPDDQRERIFDRFYQVDSSSARHYGGMGLGLALVREILDAHHRHIEVESLPGRGTTFRFTLPIAETMGAAAPELPGHRVLLVDDDPAFCQAVAAALAPHGFHVDTALTGDRAMRMLERTVPDCVILDRLLPDCDGFELLAQIRGAHRTAHLPVIVASVRRERALGMQLGADGYLAKPVELPALLEELERILAARGAGGVQAPPAFSPPGGTPVGGRT